MSEAGADATDDERAGSARGDSSGARPDPFRADRLSAAGPAEGAASRMLEEQQAAIAKLFAGPALKVQMTAASAVNRMMAERTAEVAKLVAASTTVVGSPAFNAVIAQHQATIDKLLAGPALKVQMTAASAITRMMAERNAELTQLMSVTLPAIKLPAVDALQRSYATQYSSLVERLDEPLPDSVETVGEALEDLRTALSGAEGEAGSAETEGLTETQGGDADEVAAALDAFIAIGLAGKSLVVSTTVTAWLVVVREVHRVWGRKAARQALATFITVAVTLALAAAVVVAEGIAPMSAVLAAGGMPLTILMTFWDRFGGK